MNLAVFSLFNQIFNYDVLKSVSDDNKLAILAGYA